MLDRKLAYPISKLPEICGIGRSKIYEEIAAGRLVARKVGSRTVVLAADLEIFLAALPVVVEQRGAT